MKKKIMAAMAAAILVLSGCMGTSGILKGVDTTNALGNIIGSVLGINRVSEANLVGNWRYSSPAS